MFVVGGGFRRAKEPVHEIAGISPVKSRDARLTGNWRGAWLSVMRAIITLPPLGQRLAGR